MRAAVGRIMWDDCGLERDATGLESAARALEALPRPADAGTAGLREVAQLVVRAATAREESRGAHHRSDFPDPDPAGATRTCWAGDLPFPVPTTTPVPAARPSIDLTEVA